MGMFANSVEQILHSFLIGSIDSGSPHILVPLVDLEAVFEGCKDFPLGEVGHLAFVDLPLHELKRHILLAFQLVYVVNLRLDRHVHLGNFVVLPARILIIVALILTHVGTAHLSILHHELLVKLSIQFVILQSKRLN